MQKLPIEILLLENEPLVCLFFEIGLAKLGHKIMVGHSIAEAKTKLTSSSYDVIVYDGQMVDQSVLAMIDVVRQTKPETYVVLISGSHDSSFDATIKETRADEVVGKPVNFQTLQTIINNFSTKRSARGQSPVPESFRTPVTPSRPQPVTGVPSQISTSSEQAEMDWTSLFADPLVEEIRPESPSGSVVKPSGETLFDSFNTSEDRTELSGLSSRDSRSGPTAARPGTTPSKQIVFSSNKPAVFAKELREQISGLTMIGIFSADGTALAVECVQEKYDSGMLGVMVAALYSMVKRASSIVRLGDMIMTTIEAFESTMIIRKTKTGEMLVGVLSADGAIGDFKKALDENV